MRYLIFSLFALIYGFISGIGYERYLYMKDTSVKASLRNVQKKKCKTVAPTRRKTADNVAQKNIMTTTSAPVKVLNQEKRDAKRFQ